MKTRGKKKKNEAKERKNLLVHYTQLFYRNKKKTKSQLSFSRVNSLFKYEEEEELLFGY